MYCSWFLPFAVVLGLVHVASGDERLCYPSGRCYTLHTGALTFQKALLTCGSGGSLATMRSQQEKDEILRLVAPVAQNMSAFWLGLHLPACIVRDKDLFGFVWTSGGEDTQVSEWEKKPRPTCTKKKRCVILKSRRDNPGREHGALSWFWRNVECERDYPAICRSDQTLPASTIKDAAATRPTTEHYPPFTPSTHRHTEFPTQTSRINVLCRGILGKVTYTCRANALYGCNQTHCYCGNITGGHYTLKHCRGATNESCLERCIETSNISCACAHEEPACECSVSISERTVLPSTALHYPSSSSTPPSDDDNVLDQLIVPLILGIVAFGILIMLVWGGVQMCIRKKKPKRRKSIAPALPEGNETDSTDHSSSDEEDDEEDDGEDNEEEEGEPRDRTDTP